jgi:YVTN family beta-propeller protein
MSGRMTIATFRRRGMRAVSLVLAALAAVALPSAARAQARIYVANQENASVSILDAASRRVVGTVDMTALGFAPNCKPHHAAVEPDGRYWYVSLITAGKVLKFDRDNHLVGQVSMEVPGMIALDLHDNRMIVGRSMSAVNPPSSVEVINRDSMTIEDQVEVPFPRPHAVAIDRGGEWAYVASLAENHLAVIHLTDLSVQVQPYDGPNHMIVMFAVSPDGRWLVGSGQVSGKFLVWDRANPAAPQVTHVLDVGAGPWDPVFSPDGRQVWFSNLGAGTVTVVDAGTWSVAKVIADPRLAQPNGLAFAPNGRTVFVANRNQGAADQGHMHDPSAGPQNGFVAVIDARRERVDRMLPVGRFPVGVGAPPAR